MYDYDKTRGERYKFSDGEQERVAEFNEMLKDLYAKMDEMNKFARDNRMHGVYFWYDSEKFLHNEEVEFRITVEMDDGWLQSYQDC
jgi:hypothetical protein